jgi:hypothetical protein
MKRVQITYVSKAKPETRYTVEVKHLKINNIQQHTTSYPPGTLLKTTV